MLSLLAPARRAAERHKPCFVKCFTDRHAPARQGGETEGPARRSVSPCS